MKINTTNYSNYNLYKTPYANKRVTTPTFQGLKQKNVADSTVASKLVVNLKDCIKKIKSSILKTNSSPLSVEDAIDAIGTRIDPKYYSSLLKRCKLDENPLVVKAFYNDILNLLDAGYSDSLIESIISRMSLSLDKTSNKYEYNSDATNSAIKYRNFLEKVRNKRDYLVIAYDHHNDKFNSQVFDVVMKLANKGLKDYDISCLMDWTVYSSGFNIDMVNIIPKLFDICNSCYEIKYILKELFDKLNPPDKLLINSVLQELPDKLKNPLDYIYSRLLQSKDFTSQKNCTTLDKEKFDLFNNLYKNINNDAFDESDYSSLAYIIGRCFDKNVNKELNNECTKFVVKATQLQGIDIRALSDICDAIGNCQSQALFNFINEFLNYENQFLTANIIKNLSQEHPLEEETVQRFKEFRERFVNEYDIETVSHIAGLCSNPERLKFVDANAEDENLLFYLDHCFDSDENTNKQNVQFCKTLFKEGFEVNDDLESLFSIGYMKNLSDKDRQFMLDKMVELKKYKVDEDIIFEHIKIWLMSDMNKQSFDTLIHIRNEAIKQKNILSPAGEELTDNDIEDVIWNYPESTFAIYELLGEKTFFEMFKDKIDCLEDYLDMIITDNNQKLMEVINPKNSPKYLELEENIKKAKEELKVTLNKQDVINKINTLTHKKNQMIKDSIKDPQEALSLALVYSAFGDKSSEIEPVMAQRTPEEKEEYINILNNLIFEVLEMKTSSSKTLEKLNFRKSRYLSKLFCTGDDFKENFESLVEVLETDPEKSTLEALNTLEQNIDTKEQFEELGINYEKWSEFNPNSFYKVRVKTDLEKMKQSSIRNLETDLNDDLFKKLPQNVQNEIIGALNKIGIKLKEIDIAVYEGDGFMNGTNKTLKMFKDGKPIVFDDMKAIINTLKTVIGESNFWNSKQENEQVDNARETLKNHILKLRYNEVKNALDKKAEQAIDLQVQKTDMNNISHALFLGNHASCCTAIGSGCNEWTAPNYIKNKCISSIEITDGNSFVGNTMCYIAKVDGETSLVLDNIEMKPKYQFNDNIRDAIIAYSKQLCAEIGKPDMPIYAGPNRHKVNLDMFELKERNMSIVGSTGEDKIYLDFDTDEHTVDSGDIFIISMYKLA